MIEGIRRGVLPLHSDEEKRKRVSEGEGKEYIICPMVRAR